MIHDITTKQTLDEVFQDGGAAVIDFWASWCGPCLAMAPTYEKLAEHYAEEPIRFYKLNTEHHPELSGMFNVRSIPTLIFVLDGKVVDHSIGALDGARMAKKVERLLSSARGDSFIDRLLGRRKS